MKTLSFEDLAIPEAIHQAIQDLGFEEPTPIQSLSIPVIMDGRDIIGQAHTGTGKTAAFGIPLLSGIDTKNRETQAMVICPTRELAIQVSEELSRLSAHMKGVSVIPVYGGQPIERQFQALRKGVQVIIATPGRMLDHLNRKTISLSAVRLVVLDEADEMLDMGFREDIEAILSRIPKKPQTVLFSATMSREIMDLAGRFLKEPRVIKVMHDELTVPKIEQYYYEVKESAKVDVLSRLIDMYDPRLTLVFCNTKRRVDEVTALLHARGYMAEGLHGDMNQAQRERVMSRFRTGNTDILVATDVAARGIDVENVDAVVNYDVPQDPEYYIHRIGRTGRAGREGRSFTFVSGKEFWKLKDIQKYARIRIGKQPVPTESDLRERRAEQLAMKVREAAGGEDLEAYSARIHQIMGDEFTSLDVAAALLKMLTQKTRKAAPVDDGQERRTSYHQPRPSGRRRRDNPSRDRR
jgi:ATP-dependent RNA helicase DeaD